MWILTNLPPLLTLTIMLHLDWLLFLVHVILCTSDSSVSYLDLSITSLNLDVSFEKSPVSDLLQKKL